MCIRDHDNRTDRSRLEEERRKTYPTASTIFKDRLSFCTFTKHLAMSGTRHVTWTPHVYAQWTVRVPIRPRQQSSLTSTFRTFTQRLALSKAPTTPRQKSSTDSQSFRSISFSLTRHVNCTPHVCPNESTIFTDRQFVCTFTQRSCAPHEYPIASMSIHRPSPQCSALSGTHDVTWTPHMYFEQNVGVRIRPQQQFVTDRKSFRTFTQRSCTFNTSLPYRLRQQSSPTCNIFARSPNAWHFRPRNL